MQLNGIGSGHNSDMHHVTNCLHNHSVTKKEGGAAMSSASQLVSQQQKLEQSLENNLSFTDWVKNMLGKTKSLWGKIWGTTEEGLIPGENAESVGAQEVATPLSVDAQANILSQGYAAPQDNPVYMQQPAQVARAATAVPPPQTITANPYFSAIEDKGTQQQTLWQRIKVKFESITGYFTKHFSFSNRNSFQAKQENAKEDLSKRSRYRKGDMEIDCVLTDESYLMDSYNSKGEYSRLAGEMLPKGSRDIRR